MRLDRRSMTLAAALLLLTTSLPADEDGEGVHWPSFRGPGASGVAEGYATPTTWDLETGANVRWKTAIPGIGHSSPAVWGDKVFVTTAISGKEDPELKVGLYGDITPAKDDTVHRYVVYCLDKRTGKILWERTAHEGVPKTRRHIKSSHANPAPATDGKSVVVFFGSEGLYAYDMKGKPLWEKDLGVLQSSWYVMPKAEWGFASSPVIHDGKVIIQADVMNDPFLASFDLKHMFHRDRRLGSEIGDYPRFLDLEGVRRGWLVGIVEESFWTRHSMRKRRFSERQLEQLWSPLDEYTVF